MSTHKPFPQRRRAASRGCELCAFCSSYRLLTRYRYQGICPTCLLEMVFLHQPVCCPRSSGYVSFTLAVVSRPTGGVAAAILFSFLNLNPHEKRPIRDQLAELDVIALISFVAGIVCLLIGFDFSQTTCECDLRGVAMRTNDRCLKGRTQRQSLRLLLASFCSLLVLSMKYLRRVPQLSLHVCSR